jgi:hypothetical protein
MAGMMQPIDRTCVPALFAPSLTGGADADKAWALPTGACASSVHRKIYHPLRSRHGDTESATRRRGCRQISSPLLSNSSVARVWRRALALTNGRNQFNQHRPCAKFAQRLPGSTNEPNLLRASVSPAQRVVNPLPISPANTRLASVCTCNVYSFLSV